MPRIDGQRYINLSHKQKTASAIASGRTIISAAVEFAKSVHDKRVLELAHKKRLTPRERRELRRIA